MAGKISEINNVLATAVGDELLEATATPSGTPTTKTVTPTVVSAFTRAAPLGTAALPAYAFVGDLNTGMWSATGNEIDFSTNGIQRLALTGTTSGNGKATFSCDVEGTRLIATNEDALLQYHALVADVTDTVLHLGGVPVDGNVFFGVDSGNTTKTEGTSIHNMGMGTDTLKALNDGADNVAVGFGALSAVTDGLNNVAMGTEAGLTMTTAQANVCIGNIAGKLILTGDSNMCIGNGALNTNVSGDSNTAVGDGALGATTASNNVAIGGSALATNTSASGNVAIGKSALNANTSGGQQVAIGFEAAKVATGSASINSVAIGYRAFYRATEIRNTVAIGYNVGSTAGQSSTARDNTLIGSQCAVALTTADRNSFYGMKSGTAVTTGSNNVLLGYQVADSSLTTGANNLAIGYDIEFPTNASNQMNIGALLFSGGANDNGLDVVGTNVASGWLGVGEIAPDAKLHVTQTSVAPVIKLDQQDVSEEMFEFETTVGTGNAVEAIAAKALTTTHFVKCTLTGVGTVYFPVGTIA